MIEAERIYLEATIEKAPTGKEWEVTIIGAQQPDDLLTIEGRRYVRTKNGRLYDTDALKDSAAMWEGVKVYDNHLTDEEFQRKQGMRSPATEWLGTIVKPYWDDAKAQLRGVFKVVETSLVAKLKAAYDQGILSTIGLSIDTYPSQGQDIYHEGQRLPVIDGFKMIRSVDLVAEPAAGGQFERLIAARAFKEKNSMEKETEKDIVTRDDIKDEVSAALAEALAAREVEAIENMTDEKVVKARDERDNANEKRTLEQIRTEAVKAQREADLARTGLMIDRLLEAAKLPDKFEKMIYSQFEGRVVESAEIEAAIKLAKEAQAAFDPTGKVKAGGEHDIHMGINDEDRFELEFSRVLMGNTNFRNLEHIKDEVVRERIEESKAYGAWLKAGKPDLPNYPRISSLLYDFFGGDPLLNNRAMEAATTSTLTTVVKNTVNIMTANDYAKRELWWEPIVSTEEVDTIDDSTLARVYGVNALSTVPEGAAYTELAITDEEETASFVKRGNYIGITLETLMRDKIQFVRRIPRVLADTWYNTQSDLVSGVFTSNSAAGPVLADSGALFNATAIATPGGHINLLTTALSHAQFSTVRTAMRKQTDQALGAGRKLLLSPKYLLVPVDLEVAALDIRNSELVPGADMDSAGAGAQTSNHFRNQFEVIVVPTWTDATDWAVVADPNLAPQIWLIYPRGQRTPQIYSADGELGGAMFTNDELRFKVRLMTYRFSSTYDCAPVSDFRGLHKSNVAG